MEREALLFQLAARGLKEWEGGARERGYPKPPRAGKRKRGRKVVDWEGGGGGDWGWGDFCFNLLLCHFSLSLSSYCVVVVKANDQGLERERKNPSKVPHLFSQKAARRPRPTSPPTTRGRTSSRRSGSAPSPDPDNPHALDLATAALSSASSDLIAARSREVGTGPLRLLSSASSGPPG